MFIFVKKKSYNLNLIKLTTKAYRVLKRLKKI